MGGRGVTQTISYPGASKQIQRDIELEYTKNVSGRLVSLRRIALDICHHSAHKFGLYFGWMISGGEGLPFSLVQFRILFIPCLLC